MPAISPRRMWTPEQITAMRQAYRDGLTLKAIMAQSGGNPDGVMKALKGVTYREVPDWICRAEMRQPRRAR